MPSATSASISEMTASFNCIIMASEVARGLSVITNHAFPSSVSPFVEVARCERSVHTILFVLLAASIHANVSDPEATRLSPKKSFFDRQKWQRANGSPDVFVEITRSVIPTTKAGQKLCRYRLIELYRVRVLITHRFTYDVLSTTIIENAGNGFSTYSTFSVFPVDTCNSPDFLKCNFV